jgi:hypothetical protein
VVPFPFSVEAVWNTLRDSHMHWVAPSENAIASVSLDKLDTLDADARELEATIASNDTEILET